MNLFLALFWLSCALVLFAYEHFIGEAKFRLRWGRVNVSVGWLMLALVLFNLKRWWTVRTYRARKRARELEIARAEREWQRQRRPSEALGPPDPNLNFTGEPPPSANPNITDQLPPSP